MTCRRSPPLTSGQRARWLVHATGGYSPAEERTAQSGYGRSTLGDRWRPGGIIELAQRPPRGQGWIRSVSLNPRIFPIACRSAPDGRSFAVGSSDGLVEIFDARSGAVRIRLPRRKPHPIQSLVFFPDGLTLAAAFNQESIRLYDAMTGGERLVLAGSDQPPRPCWSLALTPDARFLIAGKGVQGEPGRVVIWDLSTGRIQSVLQGHADYVRAVAVAPEGHVLATASGDETIKIWDLAAGSERASFVGHQGQVFCLAFNPTGELLASGSDDDTVRLWDVARRAEAATLRGHVGAVHSVAFTPDGARLASASRDGAIFLWDVATRRKLGNLAGHTARVNEVKFFPDGQTLISAGTDRTIRFWHGDPIDRDQP